MNETEEAHLVVSEKEYEALVKLGTSNDVGKIRNMINMLGEPVAKALTEWQMRTGKEANVKVLKEGTKH